MQFERFVVPIYMTICFYYKNYYDRRNRKPALLAKVYPLSI